MRTKIMPYVLKKVKDSNVEKYGELTCERCHSEIEHEIFHFDHIVPVSKYTRKQTPFRMNGVKNLQILCEKCNLEKSNILEKRNAYKTVTASRRSKK
jgi:5-methylcytosine-specific restriction endonuclease McrA